MRAQTEIKQQTWRQLAPVMVCVLCGKAEPIPDGPPAFSVLESMCGDCQVFCRELRRLIDVMRDRTEPHAPTSLSGVVKACVRRLLRYFWAGEGIAEMARRYAVTSEEFQREVARVIGKTYAIRGDAALDKRSGGLSDDEALSMIRDLLDELDEQLLEQEKDRPLRQRR